MEGKFRRRPENSSTNPQPLRVLSPNRSHRTRTFDPRPDTGTQIPQGLDPACQFLGNYPVASWDSFQQDSGRPVAAESECPEPANRETHTRKRGPLIGPQFSGAPSSLFMVPKLKITRLVLPPPSGLCPEPPRQCRSDLSRRHGLTCPPALSARL
jgi:hypothetical protein